MTRGNHTISSARRDGAAVGRECPGSGGGRATADRIAIPDPKHQYGAINIGDQTIGALRKIVGENENDGLATILSVITSMRQALGTLRRAHDDESRILAKVIGPP